MENRFLRVSLLLDFGCTVYEFLDKQTDTDFMFRERRGLKRLNGYQPSREGPQGAFWDYMLGGWFELFPNAGKTCVFNNITYGQHGEVAYQPWEMTVAEDTPERIALVFTVETMRTDFRLERTMELKADSASLFIRERLINLSPAPQEYMWGHHFTMGEAFLNENCVIECGKCRVLDRSEQDNPASQLKAGSSGTLQAMPGKNGGFVDESKVQKKGSGINEMLYLREFESPWIAAVDQKKQLGVALSWDASAFPYAWLWKEFNAGMTFPFFGNCYGMSFEPCSSSVPKIDCAHAAGESSVLEGFGEKTAELTVTVFRGAGEIEYCGTDGSIRFKR